ncbi:hypothetical protein GYC09_004603 [Salmonella enterica]|nr:hypothetical protein [Salmonella enterica]
MKKRTYRIQIPMIWFAGPSGALIALACAVPSGSVAALGFAVAATVLMWTGLFVSWRGVSVTIERKVPRD